MTHPTSSLPHCEGGLPRLLCSAHTRTWMLELACRLEEQIDLFRADLVRRLNRAISGSSDPASAHAFRIRAREEN